MATNTRVTPRASILTIGTELTTGQITNRNAAWISERLTALGLEVALHESVPDEHDLMLDALERCTKLSSFVFVTGGLGPTQDDFTRDVVAEWAGLKLEFHPPSWEHITARLGKFGISVAESNRRQCFFPVGAEVIPNAEGTANAFYFQARGKFVWVLPGPPREIDATWRAGVDAKLRALIGEELPDLKISKLLTWSCMGKSEAELGEITERALAGSGLLTGYRAHRPFVEVKVWVPENESAAKAGHIARLEEAIKPWVIARNGEDLGARMIERLSFADEIEIFDSATSGFLAERLSSLLRKPQYQAQAHSFDLHQSWTSPASPSEWVNGILAQAESETVVLAIGGFSPGTGEWALGLRHGTTLKREVLKSPFKVPDLLERAQRYAVELAFKRACEWIDEAFH